MSDVLNGFELLFSKVIYLMGYLLLANIKICMNIL